MLITAIQLGGSNAKSEGLNRTLKLEYRKAYGFRNPNQPTPARALRHTRTTRRPPTVSNKRTHPVTNPTTPIPTNPEEAKTTPL